MAPVPIPIPPESYAKASSMTSFAGEVDRLIQKMVAPQAVGQADPTVMQLLRAIRRNLTENNSTALGQNCNTLREYWLGSVAWCSDLSRDIEKILMMFDEGDV